MSEHVERIAVGNFTPLTPVGLAALRDMLALGGVDVSYEDIETAALEAQPREAGDWGSPTATDSRLAACVPLLGGATIHDERVQRVAADEFRLIKAYHRALRRRLSYDLGESPIAAEEALYDLFRRVHLITDICSVVAPASYELSCQIYGKALAAMWDRLGDGYPTVDPEWLVREASAIGKSLSARQAELPVQEFQAVHRAIDLLRNPRDFLHVLAGVHSEVERLLRYGDLITLGLELRKKRANETHDRPMIMAYILRENFLKRRVFY